LEIAFLNVDLEIESHESLQPIADHFGEDVSVLGCGKWGEHYHAAFETAGGIGDPDSLISFFCTLIEAFDTNERNLWENAFRREFNIGYTSGLEPRSFESDIRAATIARVCKVGASIKITIYPPDLT